jgi:small subunit ribosomal protein S4e
MGPNKIPYIVTHDARTIRYPSPDINVLDTIKINLKTGEVEKVIRFESGLIIYFLSSSL